ncbi:hypothetical protein GCM10023205_76010 [Yinghuangia aomiensis]|uniref:Secreted protein n=1 Tax=Yinghuangia aomiensis TaxID=676205 RepID=A0ABP9I993_9ACTN
MPVLVLARWSERLFLWGLWISVLGRCWVGACRARSRPVPGAARAVRSPCAPSARTGWPEPRLWAAGFGRTVWCLARAPGADPGGGPGRVGGWVPTDRIHHPRHRHRRVVIHVADRGEPWRIRFRFRAPH